MTGLRLSNELLSRALGRSGESLSHCLAVRVIGLLDLTAVLGALLPGECDAELNEFL